MKTTTHSIETLLTIWRGMEVVSADNQPIGTALALHERTTDINPSLQNYQYYPEVWRINMGNNAYIPAEYIVTIGDSDQPSYLSSTEAEMLRARWDIKPSLIAFKQSQVHKLPSEA